MPNAIGAFALPGTQHMKGVGSNWDLIMDRHGLLPQFALCKGNIQNKHGLQFNMFSCLREHFESLNNFVPEEIVTEYFISLQMLNFPNMSEKRKLKDMYYKISIVTLNSLIT